MTNAPKPKFLDVLKAKLGTLMLLSGIVIFWTAFSYPGAIAGLLIVVGILLAVFGVKKVLNTAISSDSYSNSDNLGSAMSPVDAADVCYYTALSDRNKYIRLTETIYGDNPEAKKYIAQLGSEIDKAEKIRRSNRIKLGILVTILLLIIILPLIFKPSLSTYFEDVIHEDFSIFTNDLNN